jgi:hypothetical protein
MPRRVHEFQSFGDPEQHRPVAAGGAHDRVIPISEPFPTICSARRGAPMETKPFAFAASSPYSIARTYAEPVSEQSVKASWPGSSLVHLRPAFRHRSRNASPGPSPASLVAVLRAWLFVVAAPHPTSAAVPGRTGGAVSPSMHGKPRMWLPVLSITGGDQHLGGDGIRAAGSRC